MLLLMLGLVPGAPDRDFVTRAYELLNRRLLAYGYKLSGSVQWAEDAAQAVFLEIITHLERYREMEDDELARYCYTIVKNHFYRFSKRAARTGGPELMDQDAASSESLVEDAVLARLQRADIRRALMGISEAHRFVVMQKFAMGRTHKDIARDMGISVSRSQNMLAEAMRAIRITLGEEARHEKQ